MTAVEKIIEYCKKEKIRDLNSHRGVYFNIIRFCEEQAKEMETEQKIEFACDVYDKYNFGPQEISFREECEQFKSE